MATLNEIWNKDMQKKLLILGLPITAGLIGFTWLTAISIPLLPEPKELPLESISTVSGIDKIAASPTGNALVATNLDEPLQIWNKQTGQKLRTLQPANYRNPEVPIAFSPNGKILAGVDSNNQVTLWNVQNGKVQRRLARNKNHRSCSSGCPYPNGLPTSVITFSSDGQTFASGEYDGMVQVWDVQTGQLQRTFNLHKKVLKVAFSPDDNLLNTADIAGTVQQWNLRTGKLLQTLVNPQNTVSDAGMFYPVAFSLDGKLMARGDTDKVVRLWSLQTGTWLQTLPGHNGAAHAIAFSPDSRILATAGYSGRNEFLTGGNYHNLKLWDVQTGELLAKSKDTEYITALAFDPDGKTLFTGGDPGKVKVWNISRLKPKNNANLEAPK